MSELEPAGLNKTRRHSPVARRHTSVMFDWWPITAQNSFDRARWQRHGNGNVMHCSVVFLQSMVVLSRLTLSNFLMLVFFFSRPWEGTLFLKILLSFHHEQLKCVTLAGLFALALFTFIVIQLIRFLHGNVIVEHLAYSGTGHIFINLLF